MFENQIEANYEPRTSNTALNVNTNRELRTRKCELPYVADSLMRRRSRKK
jgi:hypothetical protein